MSLLTITELAKRFKLGRTTVSGYSERPDFPKPITARRGSIGATYDDGEFREFLHMVREQNLKKLKDNASKMILSRWYGKKLDSAEV